MRITVIRAENAVSIDGKRHWVDCSHVPSFVRVYQWDGDVVDGKLQGSGHIEFVQDGGVTSFNPNEPFSNSERISFLVDAWNVAEATERERLIEKKKAEEAALAKAAEEEAIRSTEEAAAKASKAASPRKKK